MTYWHVSAIWYKPYDLASTHLTKFQLKLSKQNSTRKNNSTALVGPFNKVCNPMIIAIGHWTKFALCMLQNMKGV